MIRYEISLVVVVIEEVERVMGSWLREIKREKVLVVVMVIGKVKCIYG